MAYVNKPVTTTVEGALTDAFAEIQTLAEEMRQTFDNMDGAGMGHMPKCEAAGAAADELEQHVDCPEITNETIGALEVVSSEQINKDKRRGPSRDVRLSNALALINDAKSVLEEYEPEADLDPADNPAKVEEKEAAAEALKEAANDLASELDEHADISVEFPGMFG